MHITMLHRHNKTRPRHDHSSDNDLICSSSILCTWVCVSIKYQLCVLPSGSCMNRHVFLFKIFRCYWLRKLMMMIHDHESWIMIVQSTKHEGQPELWSWVTKQWYFASASTSPERCLKRKLDASNSKSTDAMLGFTLDMKRRSS